MAVPESGSDCETFAIDSRRAGRDFDGVSANARNPAVMNDDGPVDKGAASGPG